jgi:hypothetical protein
MSLGNERAPTVGLQEGRHRSRFRRSQSGTAYTAWKPSMCYEAASTSLCPAYQR